MEKCKFCEAELEENSTVCPVCGRDNAEEAAAEEIPCEVVVEEAATAESVPESPVAEPSVEEVPAAENTPEKSVPSATGILLTPGKLAAAAAVFILLIAIIVGLVVAGLRKDKAELPVESTEASEIVEETEAPTIPADGNPDDATCKGTYTAADDAVIASADTIVATMGDSKLTNGQLQVFYWTEVWQFLSNYGSYAQYFGLDVNQSLDTQACAMVENRTWQQFFLESALTRWQQCQAFTLEADKAGFVLDDETQASLDGVIDSLDEVAVNNGLTDANALLVDRMGAGATADAYLYLQQLQYKGYTYMSECEDAITLTDEELEAYFDGHEGDYADQGITKTSCTIDVRHILISPEQNDSGEIPEEAWAASESKAQEILNEYLAGDKTEESFAALANEYSVDPGSNTNGGLYTGVSQGEMVEEFDAWCFDATRQKGDTGIVKTTYGYHIMYFSGSQTIWQDKVRTDIINDRMEAMISEIMEQNPMTVDYSKIVLGNVNIMG